MSFHKLFRFSFTLLHSLSRGLCRFGLDLADTLTIFAELSLFGLFHAKGRSIAGPIDQVESFRLCVCHFFGCSGLNATDLIRKIR